MKFNIKHISVSALFLLVSCSTPDFKQQQAKLPLVEPKTALSVELDSLVEKQTTGRALLGFEKAVPLSDEKANDLKLYFKMRQASAASSEKMRFKKNEIVEHLKKSEFLALQKIPLDDVIRATAKLKTETADSLSNSLAQATTCAPAHVSLAFGTLAERNFPEGAAILQATQLYEKAYSCGSGEVKARAAYRLGLFSLVANDCKKAQTYWDAITSVNEVRFLFSRAEYWKNYCNTQSNMAADTVAKPEIKRAVAMDFYNNFPLSFHTIQVFKENKEELGAVVMSRANPRLQVRSEKNDKVNELVAQIELALENKKPNQAAEYLSWMSSWYMSANDERLEALEPHFKLYLGYLAYAAQDGLATFQILSKTLSQYPELKTLGTLKIFYPKWYYAQIQKAAEQNALDPLLVLSLVRQESAFNPGAVSRVGARGLMQLMPKTARQINKKLHKADLLNAEKNIKAGTVYFAGLVKRYNGNVALALAAYNAGYGAVDKWVARYKVSNPILFADLIPYRETREYVGSILRNLYWYQAMESYKEAPKVIIGDLQLAPKKDI
jgi:soluble lytic murein transglycosylase